MIQNSVHFHWCLRHSSYSCIAHKLYTPDRPHLFDHTYTPFRMLLPNFSTPSLFTTCTNSYSLSSTQLNHTFTIINIRNLFTSTIIYTLPLLHITFPYNLTHNILLSPVQLEFAVLETTLIVMIGDLCRGG